MPLEELTAADAAAVYRFVSRRVSNFEDAADIAQQTMLHACTKLSFCRSNDPSAWLLAIARHLIADYWRSRMRFKFVRLESVDAAEPELSMPLNRVLMAQESRECLLGWLNCILRGLCPEQQIAVLLADVHGHCDKDSAGLLRLSVPSFKLLLHGARA